MTNIVNIFLKRILLHLAENNGSNVVIVTTINNLYMLHSESKPKLVLSFINFLLTFFLTATMDTTYEQNTTDFKPEKHNLDKNGTICIVGVNEDEFEEMCCNRKNETVRYNSLTVHIYYFKESGHLEIKDFIKSNQHCVRGVEYHMLPDIKDYNSAIEPKKLAERVYNKVIKRTFIEFLDDQGLNASECKLLILRDGEEIPSSLKDPEDFIYLAMRSNDNLDNNHNANGVDSYILDETESVKFDFKETDQEEQEQDKNDSVTKMPEITYLEIFKCKSSSDSKKLTFVIKLPSLDECLHNAFKSEAFKRTIKKLTTNEQVYFLEDFSEDLFQEESLELDGVKVDEPETKYVHDFSTAFQINRVNKKDSSSETLFKKKKNVNFCETNSNFINWIVKTHLIQFPTDKNDTLKLNVKKNSNEHENEYSKSLLSKEDNSLDVSESVISNHENNSPNSSENESTGQTNHNPTIMPCYDDSRLYIFKMIETDDSSTFLKLFNLMKNHLERNNWDYSTLIKDGLSVLHHMVLHKKDCFFVILFFLGGWNVLKKFKAEVTNGESSIYNGKTPEEICVSFKNRKVIKWFDTLSVWDKSLNLLHIQARIGDLDEIKRLKEYSDNLHFEYDSKNCSCLFWAVVSGKVDVVDYFLKLDPDLKYLNNPKNFIFSVAGWLGHRHLYSLLYQKTKPNIKSVDIFKKTVLTRIAENSDLDSFIEFIKLKLIDKKDLETVLPIAGSNGNLNFLKTLLKKYNINPDVKDDAGKTAFIKAVEKNHLEIIKYLFDLPINLSVTTNLRKNVFHIASEFSNLMTLQLLHNHYIEKLGKEQTLVLLNSKDYYNGLDYCILIRGRDKGRESWHYVEVDRLLHKAFIDSTKLGGSMDISNYGNIILSGWGNNPGPESVSEIERRFGNKKEFASSEIDQTPLHIAVLKERFDICEFLLEKGVSLNLRDKHGSTPLHMAAMRGNFEIVKLLLKYGADVDVLNVMNKSPADTALNNKNFAIQEHLMNINLKKIIEKVKRTLLEKIEDKLSDLTIADLEAKGKDIRSHFISSLRELDTDISKHLCDVGSGPVLQSSE